MKVYKFRCNRCGYVSRDFLDREECERMKEYHERACSEPSIWVSKPEKLQPLPDEIIYV